MQWLLALKHDIHFNALLLLTLKVVSGARSNRKNTAKQTCLEALTGGATGISADIARKFVAAVDRSFL